MKKRVMISLITAFLVLAMSVGLGKLSVSSASEIFYNQVMNVVVASDDGNGNFRTGPGLDYGVITPIYNGTYLYITAIQQNPYDGLTWGQTTYNGRSGWISMATVLVTSIDQASRAVYDVRVTVADNIYLRQGPGAEYAAYSYRPYNGQTLRIDQTVANDFDGRPWGHTTINGTQGWVSLNWTYRDSGAVYNQARDVSFANNTYDVMVAPGDDATYFNSGAGLAYSQIYWVRTGTRLYVTEVLDNSRDGWVWGKTTCNGSVGWVPMNHVVVTGVGTASRHQYSVVVNNSANIRLRCGPGTEYRELVSNIPNGTSLYITQTMINSFDGRPWGRTYVNGNDGWVSLNWTERVPGT